MEERKKAAREKREKTNGGHDRGFAKHGTGDDQAIDDIISAIRTGKAFGDKDHKLGRRTSRAGSHAKDVSGRIQRKRGASFSRSPSEAQSGSPGQASVGQLPSPLMKQASAMGRDGVDVRKQQVAALVKEAVDGGSPRKGPVRREQSSTLMVPGQQGNGR